MDIRRIFGAMLALVLSVTLGVPEPVFAQEAVRASGQVLSASTLNASVQVILSGQQTVVGFSVQGLTASNATLTIEGSTDAKGPADSTKTWVAVAAYPLPGAASPAAFTTLTTDQSFRVDVDGYTDLRLRVSTTGTGNITVGYNGIPGASLFGTGGSSLSPAYILHYMGVPAVASSITLPNNTSSYAAGNIIGNSGTPASVTPPSFVMPIPAQGAYLSHAILLSNDTTTTGWPGQTVTINLYTANFTVTNGDRGAFQVATGSGSYNGSMTCTFGAVQGDGVQADCVPASGAYIILHPAANQTEYWEAIATTGTGAVGSGASNKITFIPELSN